MIDPVRIFQHVLKICLSNSWLDRTYCSEPTTHRKYKISYILYLKWVYIDVCYVRIFFLSFVVEIYNDREDPEYLQIWKCSFFVRILIKYIWLVQLRESIFEELLYIFHMFFLNKFRKSFFFLSILINCFFKWTVIIYWVSYLKFTLKDSNPSNWYSLFSAFQLSQTVSFFDVYNLQSKEQTEKQVLVNTWS